MWSGGLLVKIVCYNSGDPGSNLMHGIYFFIYVLYGYETILYIAYGTKYVGYG
jgi:hypothetical protein